MVVDHEGLVAGPHLAVDDGRPAFDGDHSGLEANFAQPVADPIGGLFNADILGNDARFAAELLKFCEKALLIVLDVGFEAVHVDLLFSDAGVTRGRMLRCP